MSVYVEHKEFEKKRKEHYKNEVNPVLLLKNKSLIEEEDDT